MPDFKCPACGATLQVTIKHVHQATNDGKWDVLRPMGDTTRPPWMAESAPVAPTYSEAHRTSPARAASIESDVSVPLRQAIITGLLVGVPVGVGVALLPWAPWWTGLLVAGGTISIAWTLLLIDHRSLLRVAEKIINRDLDGDKKIGNRPIKVEASLHREDDDGEHWDIQNLTAPSEELLREYARDLLEGYAAFSHEGGKDQSGAERYGFSRDMFNDFKDRFVEAGWAMYRNPNYPQQGAELLAGGKAILKMIADGRL